MSMINSFATIHKFPFNFYDFLEIFIFCYIILHSMIKKARPILYYLDRTSLSSLLFSLELLNEKLGIAMSILGLLDLKNGRNGLLQLLDMRDDADHSARLLQVNQGINGFVQRLFIQ